MNDYDRRHFSFLRRWPTWHAVEEHRVRSAGDRAVFWLSVVIAVVSLFLIWWID